MCRLKKVPRAVRRADQLTRKSFARKYDRVELAKQPLVKSPWEKIRLAIFNIDLEKYQLGQKKNLKLFPD